MKIIKEKKGYIEVERNGKGKEYYISNIIMVFEGKYLNGKGKEYDFNGKLEFEGKYLNGKKMSEVKYFKQKIFIYRK